MRDQILSILLFIFFLLQSLSFFNAINIISFWRRYQGLVLGIISLFIFSKFKSKKGEIIKIFILGTLVNIIFQTCLVIGGNQFLELIQPIIYSRYFNLLQADWARGRIYLTSYDQMIISFLFLSPNIKYIILSLSIVLFTILSNFRTRVLMLFFSLTGSLILFTKTKKKNIVLAIPLIVGSVLAGNFISTKIAGYSIYKRIFSESLTQSSSIVSRINQIKISLDMGKKNLGVGLGNFYDRLPSINKRKPFFANQKTHHREVNAAPHNNFALIIAESGLLTGFVYFLILVYFFFKDLHTMRNTKNELSKPIIISFWTLFIYGLFNPPVPTTYQILFWGLRGLLL
jgi:hypothetical protein